MLTTAIIVKESERPTKRRRAQSSSQLVKPSGLVNKLLNLARKRRNEIRQQISTLGSLSDAATRLSDPAVCTNLLFPLIGNVVPTRFAVDDNARWSYMGREKFGDLLDSLDDRQWLNRSAMWLYGTKGYGKSHILAALTCYLAATEARIVYIPDCRELVKDPVPYVKAAMLFAWADNDDLLREIVRLSTREEIEKFFKSSEESIFVIDQMNALDDIEVERDVSTWLTKIRTNHKAILSASANNKTYLQRLNKQNTENVMQVYGGLTENEIKHWWDRNNGIELGNYTQDEVEDYTGCIPLLLNSCVVNRKINLHVDMTKSLWEEVAGFISQRKENENPYAWERHCEYVVACIQHRAPPAGIRSGLVDHRYFYETDNVGNYACGVAREAAASQLRLHGINRFGNTALQSLDDYINNESVVGFFIEQAMLQIIEFNGLRVDSEIAKPMPMVPFEGFPTFDTSKNLALYVPCTFNSQAIDGIILRLCTEKRKKKQKKDKDKDKAKAKALLFPIQITIAKSHKNSEETFFNKWENWTKSLQQDFDIETTFLWIWTQYRSVDDVAESSIELRGQEKLKNPKYTRRRLHIEDVNKDIWEVYKRAKEKMDGPKFTMEIAASDAS